MDTETIKLGNMSLEAELMTAEQTKDYVDSSISKLEVLNLKGKTFDLKSDNLEKAIIEIYETLGGEVTNGGDSTESNLIN